MPPAETIHEYVPAARPLTDPVKVPVPSTEPGPLIGMLVDPRRTLTLTDVGPLVDTDTVNAAVPTPEEADADRCVTRPPVDAGGGSAGAVDVVELGGLLVDVVPPDFAGGFVDVEPEAAAAAAAAAA